MSTSSNFDVGRQEVESVFAVMSSEDKPMVLKIADLKVDFLSFFLKLKIETT